MIFSMFAALVASVSYGISDFLGAVAAMRLRVIPATTVGYVAATATLALAVSMTGGIWSADAIIWGAAAGACAVVGFVAFYAAMARGPMSLASPLVAVLSAAVPVAGAVLLGETLPPLAWAGIAVALVGVVMIASQPRAGRARITVTTCTLAGISGVSLGCALIALDQAPPRSGLIAALVQMVVGLVLLLVVAGVCRASTSVRIMFDQLGTTVAVRSGHQRRRATLAAVVAGLLLGVASSLMLAALQAGSLAVVSVLIALYPLGTILLARVVAQERITRLQLGGIGLALAASAALGLALG